MMRIVAVLALILIACGGSSSSPPTPTSCDPATQRVGTYLVHYDTVSSNCGTIPDSLIILHGQSAASLGCSVVYAALSSGNCREDVQLSCASGFTFTGYSVQQAQDGSHISGEISASSASCAGTYRLTWTRQ